MTYTKDIPNQKFFLNDKNIALSLAYGDILINAIPSLDLVSSLYNSLSSEDKRLNDYVTSVETSAYSISSNVDARLLQLSNTLSTYVNDKRIDDKAELSNVLSAYANSLCANISGQVDLNRTADKAELSNVLSTYVNSLCTDISGQVDLNRTADKAELSNVLSTYTDSSVLKLSTSLSNQVNDEFVHKAGDDIEFINVLGELSVKDTAVFDSNVKITGSLVQGESVKATQKGGIALGISAEAIHTNSFVWNGNDNIENYTSHGARGTFNINPEAGVNGFYIGQSTLSDIIHNDVLAASEDLTTQLSVASALLSTLVDNDRTTDKAELSNVLSAYANSLCSDISGQVDLNRTADKAELSNILSAYTNLLSTSLSNTVKNAGFAKAAATEFEYDDENHKLSLLITDYLDNTTTLTVDTTDFVKNRIVDHVDVIEDPTLHAPVLRIWWMYESGAGVHTDIPVAQLAKIYKEGYGIDITDDLTISVTNDIAKSADLAGVAATLNNVSTDTIPAITSDVDGIKTYVHKLSADSIDHRGIVATLSNAITADVSHLDELSSSMKTISSDLNDGLTANTDDIAKIKEFNTMLSADSAGTPIGAIPNISSDIAELQDKFNKATIYAKKLTIHKYHPDWITSYGNYLSSIFKYLNLDEDGKVKVGNIYEIEFAEDTGVDFTDPVFAADLTYVTADGFKLSHKDWLYITTDDVNAKFVDISALSEATVRIMPAVKFYEYYQLSNTVRQNYIWLSGNNNLTVEYDTSIDVVGTTPHKVQTVGHAIGGNNYFADGGNYFAGSNTIEILSASSLSAGTISVPWNLLKQSGSSYSLENLSTDLSNAITNKIYIDDRINDTNGNTDLSIVKLSKADYEAIVADPTVPLDNSTLYIVDAEYEDAYNRQIKNVAAPTDGNDAATKTYADNINTNLNNKIDEIHTVFSDLYDLIESINTSSTFTEVVDAVVAIKNAIHLLYVS